MSRITTELWQAGILQCPIHTFLTQDTLAASPVVWLPEPKPFTFVADPFGVWQDNLLTLFVELFDYRTKRGEIYYYRYDKALKLLDSGLALKEPWHLSYPFLFRDEDRIYMLPEAHRSGKLTLYRAVRFPNQWEPVATLLEQPVIDASILRYQDRWWMFYTLPGPEQRQMRELHIAYADTLTGPWISHPGNPVRVERDSSRPGGTPFIHENTIYVPTQDCTDDYGQAIRVLRVETLTTAEFSAEPINRLLPQRLHTTYQDGTHTLSQCGDVTLIDVKRIDHSPARRWINLERRLRRLVGAA